MRLPARIEADFAGRILVDCPACGGAAVVLARDVPAVLPVFAARRMTCTRCGAVRDQPRTVSGPARPTMDLPLRLRARTRFGELVALNEQHLAYLEAWIAATLREEVLQPGGPRNRTVLSRLPAWAVRAANRTTVLRAIRRARLAA